MSRFTETAYPTPSVWLPAHTSSMFPLSFRTEPSHMTFPSSLPRREARSGETLSPPVTAYRGRRVSPRGPSGLGRDDGKVMCESPALAKRLR